MGKYFLVAKNTWDEMLTYRLNFVMYRLRNILAFFTIYYLWVALIPPNTSLFGYTQSMMLTYIFGTTLLQSLVLSSRSYTIGDEINQGNLSNYLIRPVNYFAYWLAKDMGDKAMNMAFAAVELTILYLLLKPPIILQTDPLYLLLFFFTILIAMSLYFSFNLILGMFGFWSPEVWAPRFIFMILVSFFSGGYFPIDILPPQVAAFFQSLPFQYLLYFPIKVYLKQIPVQQTVAGILMGIVWVCVLGFVITWLWKKGLQVYTAQGK